MKISASIYSNKEKGLQQLVGELDAHDIDMLHVDCLDNANVFDDIRAIRKYSSTPIDLHIISENPEKYFDAIDELAIEYVSFQYENLIELPAVPLNSKTKFGLSIVSSTPLSVYENAPDGYSFIVIMSTQPGKSGGTFNRENFRKIIDFKHKHPKTQVHVDGGVNGQIAYVLRLLGVNAIVSGSYLLNAESLGAGMLSLHKAPNGEVENPLTVSDFLTPVAYLPVLKQDEPGLQEVLESIENYGLGFVLIADEPGQLRGVISNADVRRGILKNMASLPEIKTSGFINKSPVSISEAATLSEMLHLLNNLNFIVLFLPVVGPGNALKGAVLLNQLTRV